MVIEKIKRFRRSLVQLADDDQLFAVQEAIATKCELIDSDFYDVFPEARPKEYTRTEEWHAFIGSQTPPDYPLNAKAEIKVWLGKIIEDFIDEQECILAQVAD